jgi:hypothetical protein
MTDNESTQPESESMPTFTTNPGDELIFENDRVRVWAMNLPPHGMYDFHQHTHDHLILWPQAGRSQGQDYGSDEWKVVQNAEAGFAFFKTVGSRAPLHPHRLRNVEDFPTTHYIIELLEPSPMEGTQPHETNGRGLTNRPHTIARGSS